MKIQKKNYKLEQWHTKMFPKRNQYRRKAIAFFYQIYPQNLRLTDLKDLLFRASWMFCAYMICTSTILIHYFGAAGLCFGILSTELMVFFICLYLLYRHKKELLYGFYS